jgi:hypothetical protein
MFDYVIAAEVDATLNVIHHRRRHHHHHHHHHHHQWLHSPFKDFGRLTPEAS